MAIEVQCTKVYHVSMLKHCSDRDEEKEKRVMEAVCIADQSEEDDDWIGNLLIQRRPR